MLQHILAIVQSDLQLIFTLRRFLEANGYPSLSVARNSQEGILYLRGVGIYEDRSRYPLPFVLILDLTNKDPADLEVLAWIRERPGYADLPIVMLCDEKHTRPHINCMLDTNSFLVDRTSLGDLLDALNQISAREYFVDTFRAVIEQSIRK